MINPIDKVNQKPISDANNTTPLTMNHSPLDSSSEFDSKDRYEISGKLNKSVLANSSNTEKVPEHSPHLKSPSLNPGPAVAALVNGTENEPKKEKKSMKAMVAAAALAAAFQAPMPLQKSRDNDEIDADDKLNEKALDNNKKINDLTATNKESLNYNNEHLDTKDRAKLENIIHTENEDLGNDRDIPPSYAVDPDAGIIDCICQINEDDGFTIQCDRCFRWQHASCFNIMTNDAVPDIYLCERCDPDSFKAKSIDIKKMREQQLQLLDTLVSDNGDSNNKEQNSPQFKRKHSHDDDDSTTNNKLDEPQKKRKRNGTRDRASTNNDSKDISANEQKPEKDTERKQSRKKKKEEFDDNTNEELITRIESAKGEYFRAVYYNSEHMEYCNEKIETYVIKHYPKILESKSNEKYLNFMKISKNEYANLRKPQIIVRNILINETTGAVSSNYKFSGLSNMGLFLKKSSCSKGDLIDEMFGEVDFQVNYFKNSINQFSEWGLPKNYYFFIKPYSDDLDSTDEDASFISTKDDKTNLAVSLELYLVDKKNNMNDEEMLVPLYINCKTLGNITRFARKGCYPNCRVLPVMVGDEIKFFLQAIKDIPKDAELIVGWEFDFNPIFKRLLSTDNVNTDKYTDIMKYNFNNNFSHQEKVDLISHVEFVLSHSKCGCYSAVGSSNVIKCRFLKIKKMGSYFFRSLRKGSKLNRNSVETTKVMYGSYEIDKNSILGRLRNRDIVLENDSKTLSDTATSDKSNTKEKYPSSNASMGHSADASDDELFQQNTEGFPEISRKKAFPKISEYKLINSRVQLAKAIIANCLSIPVSSKLITVTDSPKQTLAMAQNSISKHSNPNNLSSDNLANNEIPKVAPEGKKVKKMSLTDFLRHKSN